MKTVLFLDDEPRLLDSVRQMLAPLSKEWTVLGADTVEAARAVLAERPVDVLVSDVYLPGIGGIQLLAEVKARYPHVVRVACSSCAHRDTVIRSLDAVHQFVTKPFDPGALRKMLVRAVSLQARMTNQPLRDLVAGIAKLPSLPTLYQDLVAAMQSPSATAETAGRIIAQDMAMVSKLFQIVNSVYFGLWRTISSPAQAVALLGFDAVKSLVLATKVFAGFKQDEKLPFSLEGLWTHSLRTAAYARAVAKSEERGTMGLESAFMAGLLHDVGLLVLVSNFPDRYATVMQLARQDRLPICDAERSVFQTTHADVGGFLLGLWGLNDTLVEAVVFHHDPADCVREGFSALAAVHVANVIDEERDQSLTGGTVTSIDETYLQACGLAERGKVWRTTCESAEETERKKAA